MNKIEKLVAELRELLPPLLPVRFYVRRGFKLQGLCALSYRDDGRPSHFSITIRRSSGNSMKDAVVHEWAHALAWHEGRTVCDHDPEWGLAFSRIYQEVIEP